ncbi:IS982 family transposase [Fluviispira sanaruensis]|uniref:ISSru4, transposase n=1 Tax=Fluviispira sanaruensis TaxID=2493639 RepID=A0A4P2VH75_FLUSA|nr:IS982 family transposase [Fluviispira sanaruensis]BBH52236.1 ISSru4, transposase [Fluviispira sanaruensis]
MDWQSQLIKIYLTICNFFSQLSPHTFLKISPNSNPLFTDEEVITIYIFGILNGLKNVKSIFKYIKNFLFDWFPYLPSYEGFLFRLNSLNNVFPELVKFLLKNDKFKIAFNSEENITLVDSLPIMLTKNSRFYKCKTANDISSIGYCSSKETYYYGLKIHLIATFRNKKLATPKFLKVTKASVHDLTAIKEDLLTLKDTKILADKAYIDKKTKRKLGHIGSEIHTPIKLSKSKKELSHDEKVYSKIVSSFRQSIEILFSWLIETSGIQIASKVRSSKGLIVHVFGRFSACLFKYMFIF